MVAKQHDNVIMSDIDKNRQRVKMYLSIKFWLLKSWLCRKSLQTNIDFVCHSLISWFHKQIMTNKVSIIVLNTERPKISATCKAILWKCQQEWDAFAVLLNWQCELKTKFISVFLVLWGRITEKNTALGV